MFGLLFWGCFCCVIGCFWSCCFLFLFLYLALFARVVGILVVLGLGRWWCVFWFSFVCYWFFFSCVGVSC